MMYDISFDLTQNDLALSGGDFVISEVSDQNAALIFLKGMVSIQSPYWGVGFEERALNAPVSFAQQLVAEAKAQVRSDGAQSVSIQLSQDANGNYVCNVNATY